MLHAWVAVALVLQAQELEAQKLLMKQVSHSSCHGFGVEAEDSIQKT